MGIEIPTVLYKSMGSRQIVEEEEEGEREGEEEEKKLENGVLPCHCNTVFQHSSSTVYLEVWQL